MAPNFWKKMGNISETKDNLSNSGINDTANTSVTTGKKILPFKIILGYKYLFLVLMKTFNFFF